MISWRGVRGTMVARRGRSSGYRTARPRRARAALRSSLFTVTVTRYSPPLSQLNLLSPPINLDSHISSTTYKYLTNALRYCR